ncbi:MAG TPA: GGDEF domain-containing protein [Miltoncostaeaceae bacterium]|nr:GGDEF domain-containing protein [Miltoncostaeaceae bacterium]
MTTNDPGPRPRDRAEAQFLLLAESAAEMIVRADPDGDMTYVSPASLQITGFAPHELLGCAAWELAHPDDLPVWRASRERLGWGLDGETLTYRGRRRGGAWVMLESTLRAVRDAEGEVVELQIATRDVTERALADAEHAALHRVTKAVASESEGATLYPLVAREMARLLDAAAGRVVRYRGGAEEEVGTWRRPGPQAGGGGPPHVVSAPIRVHGRLWGAVAAVFRAPTDAPWGAAERVERFAQLVRLAVANAETRARLVEQATTDALTGLVNHATFHVALSDAFAEAIRERRALALAVIDLDRFKALNDTLGHRAGDVALAAIGDLLRRHARGGDIVGRTGGEELAWLMPETRLDGGRAAAERLRAAIAEAPVGGPAGVTASIGVTDLRPSDADPDEVFRRADAALYHAKEAGRDRVVAT